MHLPYAMVLPMRELHCRVVMKMQQAQAIVPSTRSGRCLFSLGQLYLNGCCPSGLTSPAWLHAIAGAPSTKRRTAQDDTRLHEAKLDKGLFHVLRVTPLVLTRTSRQWGIWALARHATKQRATEQRIAEVACKTSAFHGWQAPARFRCSNHQPSSVNHQIPIDCGALSHGRLRTNRRRV